ncbi:MAG: ABC transporter permease subunit [Planctomycetota bacterium]
MILHIVKKEVLENLLSLRFAVTCVICFVVVTASIGILGREYVDDLYDYNRNANDHRAELEKQNRPRVVMFAGISVDKPVTPMAIFNKGIDDAGRTAKVYGRREPEYFTKKGRNPVAFLFPPVDLLFFVAVIMSLLAIVFSYDAVSGEHNNETLKLMVSYPVSRSAIIIGKWLGGYLCLMLPFMSALVAGLLLLFLVVPDMALSGVQMARLGLLVVLATLFISVVYTAGIMVSAATARPSSSITVLLLVWVLFALVIPNISPSVAAYFLKPVNIQEIEAGKRKVIDDLGTDMHKRQGEYLRTQAPGQGRGNPAFRIWRSRLQREQFDTGRRALENINRNFRLRMEKEIVITQWISRLSPLASLKYAAGALTETGQREDFTFRAAVDDYLRQAMGYIYDEQLASDEDGFRVRTGLQAEAAWKFDPKQIPSFNYASVRQADLGGAVAAVMVDAGLLICWNVLFFIAAFVLFVRYDVK